MTATVANGESSRGPEFKDLDRMTASRSGPLNPMFSIQAALSKIKNGFNRPQFVEYQKEHEQLYKEVSNTQTRSDPEFIMAQAAELSAKFRSEPEGTPISKFPSMDGSGNDLTDKRRGQVGDGYSRLVPAEYCTVDKAGNPSTPVMGEPRCISELSSNGNYVPLPNERAISLLLAATNGNDGEVTVDETRTMVGPLWGQFVTHDIIQTPDVPDPRDCACEGTDDICKAVHIPEGDPVLDPDIAECMIIKRSAPHVSSEGALVREQMNQKSAFMDLSQVYGSTEFELSQLRDDDGMHLKSRTGRLGGPHGNQGTGDLLAFTQDSDFSNFTTQFEQHSTFNDDNFKDFIAGDNRVEENPYLASFTTIFMRYHNDLVDKLSVLRDDWEPEDVFQTARLITISVYKNIHYNEALKSMLGENQVNMVNDLKLRSETRSGSSRSMQRMELTEQEWDQGKRPWNPFQTRPDKKRVKEFRQRQEEEAAAEAMGMSRRQRMAEHQPPLKTEPSIRNEFAAAGYRMHGQVSSLMKAMNHAWEPISHAHADEPHEVAELTDDERATLAANPGSSLLKFNFFDPEWVHRKGPGGCLRGAMKMNQLKMDGTFSKDLAHNLFKPHDSAHGVDLAAINIARGREHGIGSYGAIKSFCQNHAVYSRFYRNMQTDEKLFHSRSQVNTIRNFYIRQDQLPEGKSQDDYVDMYVGMQLEKHMPGGSVGPTAGCVIAEQFVALKEGDRFWFENFGVFTVEQLQNIKLQTLASVSCSTFEARNGAAMLDTDLMAVNPFLVSTATENVAPCSSFAKLDTNLWQKNDDPETDPVLAACQYNNKAKALDCSGLNWDDDDIRRYLTSVSKSKKWPFQGKKDIIEFKAIKLVQRITLANNKITDLALIERLCQFAKSKLLELDISGNPNLQLEAQAITKFTNYPLLGHINFGDNGFDCVPVYVLSNLSDKLRLVSNQIRFPL